MSLPAEVRDAARAVHSVPPSKWLRHEFCRKYLLNRTSGGVGVGEVVVSEGDAGGFAGGGGWRGTNVEEVDALVGGHAGGGTGRRVDRGWTCITGTIYCSSSHRPEPQVRVDTPHFERGAWWSGTRSKASSRWPTNCTPDVRPGRLPRAAGGRVRYRSPQEAPRRGDTLRQARGPLRGDRSGRGHQRVAMTHNSAHCRSRSWRLTQVTGAVVLPLAGNTTHRHQQWRAPRGRVQTSGFGRSAHVRTYDGRHLIVSL